MIFVWPLTYGYSGDEKVFLMPYFWKKNLKASLTNYGPLFETIDIGNQN